MSAAEGGDRILAYVQEDGASDGAGGRLPLYWVEGWVGGRLEWSSPSLSPEDARADVRECRRDLGPLPVEWSGIEPIGDGEW